MNIIQKPVPNFTKGRKDKIGKEWKPDIVVIHIGEGSLGYIYEKTLGQIYSTFVHEERSSHYAVGENGEVNQYVEETDMAWGNGVIDRPSAELVKHRGNLNPNLYTISIEHEGYASADITQKQYESTAQLVKEICRKWSIPIDRRHIIRHDEIRKSKNCPGKIDVGRIVNIVNKPETNATSSTSKELVLIQQKISWIQAIINSLKTLRGK